jgi:hypothetical protein
MFEGFEHTLTCESIKRAEQDEIEFPPRRVLKQFPELWAVCCLAGRSMYVLMLDNPVRSLAELPQLTKLILYSILPPSLPTPPYHATPIWVWL